MSNSKRVCSDRRLGPLAYVRRLFDLHRQLRSICVLRFLERG